MIDSSAKKKLLDTDSKPLWEKIELKPHHGVCTPIFSIIGEETCGIGDFQALKMIVDFCNKVGFNVIQLLPLADTGNDPSPYNPLSACSLNPAYLSLKHLPYYASSHELVEKLSAFEPFNHLQKIDYVPVRALKIEWLQAYFEYCFSLFENAPSFHLFLKENKYWLDPYALYMTYKEKLNNIPCNQWSEHLQNPCSEKIQELIQINLKQVNFFRFLQFLCHEQCIDLKAYAQSKGVNIMGDLPILISSDSADIWAYPEYFDTSFSAGCPPDIYNPEGQNWGFPIYNWEALEKTDHIWWEYRLKQASQLYHLFRIDHLVGLFRIWAIPEFSKSTNGFFIPREESQWYLQGEYFLKWMIEHSEILPIGEDLGSVPDQVRDIMKRLGICGTKVMRWERKWEEIEPPYKEVDEYPEDSLCTLSTHDSEPIRSWWKYYPKEAKVLAKQKNWNYTPQLEQDQLLTLLKEAHRAKSIFCINPLQEYLGLVPELAWEDPDADRINLPGTVLESNWTFRFKFPLEKMLFSEKLISICQEIIRSES